MSTSIHSRALLNDSSGCQACTSVVLNNSILVFFNTSLFVLHVCFPHRLR